MSINIVLARKSTKQSWAQAPTVELKDMAPERLAQWIDGANSILGWKKYQASSLDQVQPVDAGATNDGVVEPESLGDFLDIELDRWVAEA